MLKQKLKWMLEIGTVLGLSVIPVALISSCTNDKSDDQTNQETPPQSDIHKPLEISGTTQPDPSLKDHEKAFINAQIYFEGMSDLFMAWKASDVKVYNIYKPSKDTIIPGLVGKPSLGFIDPRQNYGFQMHWKAEPVNDDDNGTKSGTLVLTRGKEIYEKEFVIKSFLPAAAAELEQKHANINPDKAVQFFNRNQLRVRSIETTWKYLDDFVTEFSKDNLAELQSFKKAILEQKYWEQTDIEFRNFQQVNRLGLPAPEVEADYRLIDHNDPNLKSGWYKVRWFGFDVIKNGLRTQDMLPYHIREWATFSSPILPSDRSRYKTVKASSIKTVDDFLRQADDYFLKKQTVIATPTAVGAANDDEGSLEVTFKFEYKYTSDTVKPLEDVTVKIYGFLPNGEK